MVRLFFFCCCCWPLFALAQSGNRPLRILTLGIRHESNTFSTGYTRLEDFQLKRGAEVTKDVEWASVARQAGIELIPTLHAYSWPGGTVETRAYDAMKAEILDSIRMAGRIDGIYMEMHGAMHVAGYEDAQADLIRQIRQLVGNDVMISASFDLHGNLSPDFVRGLNIVTSYRTAPHRDIEETKTRAVRLLMETLQQQLRPHIETVTIPILVPGEKSITDNKPLQPIYAQLPALNHTEGIMDASILAGYCWGDLPRSAMRVFVVARNAANAAKAKSIAQGLARQIWSHRQELQLSVPAGDFPAMLLKAQRSKNSTVFISDAGDNTTAGAPGDNTYVLKHLLDTKAKNVLLAGMVDTAAFATCQRLSPGDSLQITIGANIDYRFSKPLAIRGKLIRLSAPSTIGEKRGAALVDINGISLVILNNRRSFTELRDFSELQLDPLSFKVVIVKLGYLFPQLQKIAPEQLMALTDGFCNLDIPRLPYTHVPRPSYPLDPGMQWDPADTTPDYSLQYEGRATTSLVGDGKYIVKTTPDFFESVKVLPLQGRLHFSRQGDAVLPASTLWRSTVFPGGVRYSIRIGHDSLQVSYGVLPKAGFTVLAETPLNVQTALQLDKGQLTAVTRRVGDQWLQFWCQHPDGLPVFHRSADFRDSLEKPYHRQLVLETPLPNLNKAVAFSQALLDLSYNGELMYCELFRWLDIWARDLGSGLLPGALVSGRPGMARQSLVYDLNRYASMSPEDCKNSNDPSQGGTASEVGWTARSIWNYYQYSGQIDSLRKDAAIMRPWVEHWIKRDYDDDGLITDVTDFMDHMIMMLSTNGVQTLASNSMYASLLYYAGRIEKELGNKSAATRYEQLYQRTVNALNTRFWNEDKGYFSNLLLWDSTCHRSSQASQAMLLKIGATDAARTRRTLQYLQNTNWTPYGSVTITPRMNHVDMDNDQNVKVWPWWNLWEAEARFQHGDAAGGLALLEKAAQTIEDEKYPGLIEETLDTTGISTGGNVFVTAAGNLLETVVKDLMGIAPVTPGWKTVQVLPAVPAAWESYRCKVPTPGGEMDIRFSKGRLHITVSDPSIRFIVVKDTANTDLTGAVKRAITLPAAVAQSPVYSPVANPVKLPFRGGKALLFYDAAISGTKPALDMETIDISGLEKLDGRQYTQLVVTGNALPLHTSAGKPVKELLDRFLARGSTIVLYGARTAAKTDEDGAGILGEQNGLIDWYDNLPGRETARTGAWQFEPFPNNPEGQRRSGAYTSTVTPGRSWAGKDLVIELGPLTGLDSVFVNGISVAQYRDMEPLIRQEYPTRTRYRDTHRYKMLSRYYTVKKDSPAYAAFRFGEENTISVHLYNDGLSRGILESNQASVGMVTTANRWQPVDEALPGIGLAQPKRKGINYWGSEQFFNSWSTKHGLFGFRVNGAGLSTPAGSPLQLHDNHLVVEDIYTDFALFKPWRFEALAYTHTRQALLYPGNTERYPCLARIINTQTGGNFIVVAPAIASGELGPTVLQQLQIDSQKRQ